MIETARGDPLRREGRNESPHSETPPIEGFTDRPYEDRRFRGTAQGQEPMSVTGLFRRLIDDVTTLFRKELAMATAEVLQSVDEAKSGTVGMVGGGAVLYGGFLFLLLSATLGLMRVVPGWAAALIVGATAMLIGFIMIQASKRKLKARSFAPTRAVDELRKDREMIGRQLHEHDAHTER